VGITFENVGITFWNLCRKWGGVGLERSGEWGRIEGFGIGDRSGGS
jgi:hypothetical protein